MISQCDTQVPTRLSKAFSSLVDAQIVKWIDDLTDLKQCVIIIPREWLLVLTVIIWCPNAGKRWSHFGFYPRSEIYECARTHYTLLEAWAACVSASLVSSPHPDREVCIPNVQRSS